MTYTLEELKKMMDDNDGNLDLRGCTGLTSLPEGLTVGGDLYLEGCTGLTSLPDGLTVGASLYLRGCTGLTSLPEGLAVGGDLDLRGCTGLTSLPEGLAVGGDLYLEGCTGLTSLPEGLAVNGYLDLEGCTGLTSLPEGLAVNGYLDLEGCTGIIDKCAERKKVRRLVDGEYVKGRYLYADGILTHVARKKKIGQYDFFVGKIKGKNVVFDGENYAHCKDFKIGVCDLEFKKAKNRGADQYKHLTFESVVAREDAIVMYRVITGACQAGTEQFLESIGDLAKKESYTVQEIIDLTRGNYGASTFEAFFKKERYD